MRLENLSHESFVDLTPERALRKLVDQVFTQHQLSRSSVYQVSDVETLPLFRCSWSWRRNRAVRPGSFIQRITSPPYVADCESASKASQMATRDSDTTEAERPSWEDNG